eukprot:3114750-Pyramimonas_sp.AAC.1
MLHGQSEDVSGLLSEGDSSHSIEKNDEHARFHTSPGPSYHLDPLPDRCVDPVSGAAPLVSEAADRTPILDSDDDFEEEGSPDRGGCSSAQPTSSFPDGIRARTNSREFTGMTPQPTTKKPKGENDDLNSSPLVQGFYRPDFSLPRSNRDRVPELYELVMQDERDDSAQNRDVDFINRGVRTRELHAPTPNSERGRS